MRRGSRNTRALYTLALSTSTGSSSQGHVRHPGPHRETLWQKAARQPRWGRPLEQAVAGLVIAAAAVIVLSVAVVVFFGLIYGW
jgi:hypothetical protein